MKIMTSRLASIAPELALRLDALSDADLMNVVAVLTYEAVTRTGLDEPVVESAMLRLRGGTTDPQTDLDLHDVAARLDEIAWDLRDADEPDGDRLYEESFQRARAASAVAFACESTRSAEIDAIYEAQTALGSLALARRIIEPLLPAT